MFRIKLKRVTVRNTAVSVKTKASQRIAPDNPGLFRYFFAPA